MKQLNIVLRNKGEDAITFENVKRYSIGAETGKGIVMVQENDQPGVYFFEANSGLFIFTEIIGGELPKDDEGHPVNLPICDEVALQYIDVPDPQPDMDKLAAALNGGMGGFGGMGMMPNMPFPTEKKDKEEAEVIAEATLSEKDEVDEDGRKEE